MTIVLPPRLMAGHPATLAVLGADGKLAPGVDVELGDGQRVTTDRTGRAAFRAPAKGDYLLAKSSPASAAALVDPAVAESEPKAVALSPIVSAQDGFWICGAGLSGDADANIVKINGESALVLAASPICFVALAGSNVKLGSASVSIEAPGVRWSAKTILVVLEFEPPSPALKPGESGQLVIHARGSTEKLAITLQNGAPGVLRFARGDTQDLITSGGPENTAMIRVQAMMSGQFSFSVRLIPAPEIATAERFLKGAQPLAPKELQGRISKLADRLARHPRDAAVVRAQLKGIEANKVSDECRELLDAAGAAL